MKSKEIRDLITFIAESGLDEVNLETEEIKLHVKKQASATVVQTSVVQAAPMAPAPVVAAPVAPVQSAPVAEAPKAAGNESKYVAIKSPMIGTFYRSPKPDAPALVSVGDKVSVGQGVCIIEAMKLFNEIESEISGTIVKVLVENASPVEYDQPLFLVDPS